VRSIEITSTGSRHADHVGVATLVSQIRRADPPQLKQTHRSDLQLDLADRSASANASSRSRAAVKRERCASGAHAAASQLCDQRWTGAYVFNGDS